MIEFTIEEIRVNGKDLERAVSLGIEGLLVDGLVHKQWYIEQVLGAIGVDLEKLRTQALEQGHDCWWPGMPP